MVGVGQERGAINILQNTDAVLKTIFGLPKQVSTFKAMKSLQLLQVIRYFKSYPPLWLLDVTTNLVS